MLSVLKSTFAPDSNLEFRINNFDLLRIFAATQVLLFHSLFRLEIDVPFWIKPLEHFPGVPMFFVISGYLVSASYERQSNVFKYFWNRLLRIYPALWVCIGVTTIITLLLGYVMARPADFLWVPAQLAGLIYTPPFLKSFGSGSYNGSLWTIPVELQFYFVLPVVYTLIRMPLGGNRILWILFGCFVVATLALEYAFPAMGTDGERTIEKLIRYSFVPHIYMFLLGVILQRHQLFKSSIIAGKGIFWVIAFIAISEILPDTAIFRMIASLILGLSVISVAYTSPKTGDFLLRGQDISYGVYIYHGLVINLLVEYQMMHRLSDLVIVLVTSYALAAISWRFVERPFMLSKSKLYALRLRKKRAE
jgi:peptidoglycan/LPS O-acetylase OafA/YrhL